VLTAALLIGRTAGAERFRSDACFGRQSGSAPIPCSSGQQTQHRLDPGGDRQLNRALHTIAITRAQRDPATKEYLARKEAEGRTKKGALRCLKRYLARRFYRLLSEPPLPPERTIAGEQAAQPDETLDAPALDASRDMSPSVVPGAIPARPVPKRETQRITAGPNPMICIA